jgi:hypothetical protein
MQVLTGDVHIGALYFSSHANGDEKTVESHNAEWLESNVLP